MRIVAGALGGRRLRVPRGTAVRPTSDRVREAVFSILGPLDGLAVLDLFAGSGAMAIEALSRGAARATLVDNDRQAMAAVRDNLRAFDLHAETHLTEATAFLKHASRDGRQYDLVFIDPPYRRAQALTPRLSAVIGGVLAPSARVVTESDVRARLELDLDLRDERRYGQTLIQIFHAPA